MPANESSMRVYFKERFHTKVVYEKYVFTNIGKDCLLKKCQLRIDSNSNKYLLKIFLRKIRSAHHISCH